jgi:prepilin-type processing-associated H-X9-DG protein
VHDSLYNEPALSLGSYAYNAELGGDVSNDAMEENVYKVRLSAVKDGPSTIYFGETDDNVESHGWVFSNVNNAPQGNHKDKVHCCMLDGHVEAILNKHLKEPSSFEFFTKIKDKNYSARPSN